MTVPVPHRVVRSTAETSDTTTVLLEPEGPGLAPFRPGQFAMMYAFGRGEAPISVSGWEPPGAGGSCGRLVHTVRAVGAVSAALRGLRPGDRVGVRGPYGTGWDLAAAEGCDVLVVAGGLGLAPLRPLVAELVDGPGRFGSCSVLVGARTPADLLYRGTLRTWAASPRVAVATTVDRPGPGWTGDVGVVTALLDRVAFHPPGTAAFVCGPEVMMRATARELVHRGVPAQRIQLSLERTMHCGTGHCGHCQLGPVLLCRDGPVVGWDRAERLLTVREL
ncbi:FAD/NAD(P)-binding protein [Peterkaempfera griseoplana]|uniref:FAD/NAD(P)-binding protein n=1 Tax=Peterkaempfera griseoplana TaxID=66896 RepID=UPI0006E3898F|nr:FAD/NAD(P)-binding protein [Peterkaempfera griseoplana]